MGVLCQGAGKESGQEDERDLHLNSTLSKTAEVIAVSGT